MTSYKTDDILQSIIMVDTAPAADFSQYVNAPLLQKSPKPLEGQWAIVTGATRFNGLGFGIAERLALDGASIFVVGTENSQHIAPFVVQRLKAYGVEAHSFVGDLTQEEACTRIIADAYKITNRIDILVNNAGRNTNKPITEVTAEIFHQVHDPKAIGAFYMSREWAKMWVRKGFKDSGRIVNIGSPVGSIYGNFGQAPYAMANGALYGLTQSLALDLGGRGVNTNLVAPTFVEGTEITAGSEAMIPIIKASNPTGRLPGAHDIGAAVAFLVGPDGAHINGVVLPVDEGGKSNHTAIQPLFKAGFREVPKHVSGVLGDITIEDAAAIKARKQGTS